MSDSSCDAEVRRSGGLHLEGDAIVIVQRDDDDIWREIVRNGTILRGSSTGGRALGAATSDDGTGGACRRRRKIVRRRRSRAHVTGVRCAAAAAAATLLSYAAAPACAFVSSRSPQGYGGPSSSPPSLAQLRGLPPAFIACEIDGDGASTTTALEAVRKRKGDFAGRRVAGEVGRKTKASVGRRRASKNVFQQFSSSYASSPLDIVAPPPVPESVAREDDVEEDHRTTDGGKRRSGRKVNRNIARLLVDDDGEEDASSPDDSLEAANQIADRASVSTMSEEARHKANRAVQKKSDEDGGDSGAVASDGMAAEAVRPRPPRKMKTVRATVKETGNDTMSSYIKSMGQHELLRKEDEIVLGRQIQILVRYEEERQKLEEKLLRAPTFAQWADAVGTTVPELKKQIRRSQRAKAALVEANLRLVVTVARQTVKRSRSEINFQDACQEGIIGLTRACEKFDPEMGFRFSTYAIWWIKKEVHRNVSEQGRQVRLPASAIKKINDIRINERVLMDQLGRRPTDEEVADKCGMNLEQLAFYRKSAKDVASLDKKIDARKGKGSTSTGSGDADGKTMQMFVQDTEHPTPAESTNQQMMKDDIRRLIRTLSPKEQAVIRLRFGLDDGEPRTLDYIGKKFSVAKERVRKIEARALLKLRQPYRNQSVQCYVSDL